MKTVIIIKQDIHGQETWRYQGKLIEARPHVMVIEAFFDREEVRVYRLVLRRGDRFVETYFDNRWYNIYQVFDREDGSLKGWYCNICFPARFTNDTIAFRDLALDLVVYPDGEQVLLDQEEFDTLPLDDKSRVKALAGLSELQAMLSR
jgi:hypothetical protein